MTNAVFLLKSITISLLLNKQSKSSLKFEIVCRGDLKKLCFKKVP